ncbi:hypothetical protein PLUTE_b0279 [Pseudoalteromonas luteoviolacea DSM 6061]|nr:hypothetical protein [Pseudoalteromonas luteoviolacea DSM 6061]
MFHAHSCLTRRAHYNTFKGIQPQRTKIQDDKTAHTFKSIALWTAS